MLDFSNYSDKGKYFDDSNAFKYSNVISSIQIGGIRTFCPKKLDKKVDKVHKDFWTISSIHALFVMPKYLNIPRLYVAYKKKIFKTIWSGSICSIYN